MRVPPRRRRGAGGWGRRSRQTNRRGPRGAARLLRFGKGATHTEAKNPKCFRLVRWPAGMRRLASPSAGTASAARPSAAGPPRWQLPVAERTGSGQGEKRGKKRALGAMAARHQCIPLAGTLITTK
eukprot:scaffold7690_cov618-Prasinococcus_capsulatus_cf.AAC.1